MSENEKLVEQLREALTAAAAALAAAEARIKMLEAGLEGMRPHVAKVVRCIAINNDMGRVVTGQTEAAAEIGRVFEALTGASNDG